MNRRAIRYRTAARVCWAAAAVAMCAFLVVAFAVVTGHRPAGSGQAASAAAVGQVLDQPGQGGVAQSMFRHPVVPLAPPTAARAHRVPRPPAASPSATTPPASTAPAASDSAPSPASGLTPQATAEYQTPKGSNELAWSEAILRALGDPLTNANIISMGYWMQNEAGSPPSGIVGANNPINVSQPGFGGWAIKSEGGGWSLYSYPTPQDGIDATVKYLTPTGYPLILNALKAGEGLSSSSLANELGIYSGHGYTTIPDTWGASQGQPETP